MLQPTFSKTTLSQSKPSEWYSHFKNGHTAINNDPHTGWLSTAQTNKTVDHIREFISKNWHLTIRELVDELSISVGTILMHNLGMRRVGQPCSSASHKR